MKAVRRPEDKRVQNLAVTMDITEKKERELIDVKKLGQIVKRKRVWFGSRNKFSFLIGLAPYTVFCVEHGRVSSQILTLDRIARAFGLKLSELIALAEEP